jgi:nucleotide-binding universal stress UspA family protein
MASVQMTARPHLEVKKVLVASDSRDALLQARLTVVGTAGRSGLSQLLIGNTAEQLASDLATDLLTIRATERSG